MMCSFHHSCLRASSTHAWEMFQSSCTSWSSKIIIVETVESSQRIAGSLQLSRYSFV